MSEQIDWSKAPECADKYNTHNSMFYKGERPGLQVFWDGRWRQSSIMKSNERFVYRPTATSWSAEGLPPVGVVCEVKQMARGAEREWFKAEVLYSSHYTVVLDDYQAGEFVSHPCTLQFRPIRTPEQIAADERKHGILQMIDVFGMDTSIWGLDSAREICAFIYDAGYRKEQK